MNEPESFFAEPFSAGYDLIGGIDILSHGGEEAIMHDGLFYQLSYIYGEEFMAKAGGKHYMFKPQGSMPTLTAAIPDSTENISDSLLIKL